MFSGLYLQFFAREFESVKTIKKMVNSESLDVNIVISQFFFQHHESFDEFAEIEGKVNENPECVPNISRYRVDSQ